MGDFIEAILDFPTVLFSFLLVVVIGYWLVVLLGGADLDMDTDVDGDVGGATGFLAGLGLGGVPVTVALSLLTVLAWFVSLTGTALLGGLASGIAMALLSIAVLAVALLVAWIGTRLLVRPLRPIFPNKPEASRGGFVGRLCVIRTGRVTADFGQAEVTAADGSSAIVQVRQSADEPLRAGSTALIYDYDADGEFFWVTPVDAALDPHRPTHP
jgi:Protein of unknown function (DUF1449)